MGTTELTRHSRIRKKDAALADSSSQPSLRFVHLAKSCDNRRHKSREKLSCAPQCRDQSHLGLTLSVAALAPSLPLTRLFRTSPSVGRRRAIDICNRKWLERFAAEFESFNPDPVLEVLIFACGLPDGSPDNFLLVKVRF
jgi:hypothetical protein